MLVQKNNLIICFLHKEGIYWRRMWNMKKKKNANWIKWGISTFFVTLFHYAYALMHFLFECFLYVFNRKQFTQNLDKLNHQILLDQVKRIKYGEKIPAVS